MFSRRSFLVGSIALFPPTHRRVLAFPDDTVPVIANDSVAVHGPVPGSLARVSKYRLSVKECGTELKLLQRPVATWSGTSFGSTGGSLYLWTLADRPAAALRTWLTKKGECYENLRSFCDSPLVAKNGTGTVIWSPESGAEPVQAVSDRATNVNAHASRLESMKAIASDFKVRGNFIYGDGMQELRCEIDPLYRFTDGQADGAVFAFSKGEAPGVLLILEARKKEDESVSWYYALGAIGVFDVWVDYQGERVWQEPRRTAKLTEPTDLFHSRKLDESELGV